MVLVERLVVRTPVVEHLEDVVAVRLEILFHTCPVADW